MRKILAVLLLWSNAAFATDRLIVNPDSGSNIQIKTNVSGTPTTAGIFFGSNASFGVNSVTNVAGTGAPQFPQGVATSSITNTAGTGAPNFPFGASGITATISDLTIASVATPNATINGGSLLVSDGKELSTYSGSGATSGSFNVNLIVNLTTILGSSPANATTYYLYVDLTSLAIPIIQTDTGRVVRPVTQANLFLSTTTPENQVLGKYTALGFITSATTGNAWSGAGSAFGSAPTKTNSRPSIMGNATIFTQPKTVVGAVGSVGQFGAGHILAQTEWPFATTGKLAYWNFSSSPITDGSGALSCSGSTACTLTNSGTPVAVTASNVFGITNAAASLNGINQQLTSTDSFFNPPTGTSFAAGGWFFANWSVGGNTTLLGQWPSNSDRGWDIQPTANVINFQAESTASGSEGLLQVTVPATSAWHHFVLLYDSPNTKFKAYVDGKLAALMTLATVRATTGQIFSIANSGNAGFFTGSAEDLFFVRGFALSDEDIHKIYAYRLDHNKNVLAENQLWRFDYERTDGFVSNTFPIGVIVDKQRNSLFLDLSFLSATDKVAISLQDSGLTGTTVPTLTYDSGNLVTDPCAGVPCSIAHGLPAVPTTIQVLYEKTAGAFDQQAAGSFCSQTATQLNCDFTSLTIGASNRLRIIASTAAFAIAVPPASATQTGLVTNGAQTFSAPKTFSGPGGFSPPQVIIDAAGTGNGAFIEFTNDPTHLNWVAGTQGHINNGFEITPSTAVGGSTFTVPAFVINGSGQVLIGAQSTPGADSANLLVSGTAGASFELNGTTGGTRNWALVSNLNTGGHLTFEVSSSTGTSPLGSANNVGDIDQTGSWTLGPPGFTGFQQLLGTTRVQGFAGNGLTTSNTTVVQGDPVVTVTALATVNNLRLSNAGTITITCLPAVLSWQQLNVFQALPAGTFTLQNNNASCTQANKIFTATGADLTGLHAAVVLYDANNNNWVVLSSR